MSVELICVRHGRTAWNADRRFQGHTDIPLDDEGRAQARVLAGHLKATSLAFGVASDLGRAVETAQIVLGPHGVPLRLDEDLREMRFGAWEGLTWPQIVERTPALANENEMRPKFYTPEGGESFDAVCVRSARALGRIRRVAPNGSRVLVATHAGVLHAILRVLLGESESEALRVRFKPASICRFALDEHGGTVIALNEVAEISPHTA